MSTEDTPEEFKKKLDALKPKKKKLAVPEGFLESAKSYEGKLEPPKKQIEPPVDAKPKEPPKKKGFFGKK